MEPNLVKKSGFTENTVRKQKKILVIAVICVITLFIGTSYSLLTNFDTKNDNNVLSFENDNLKVTVNKAGLITLDKNVPEADEIGLKKSVPTVLTITNTGNTDITKYSIILNKDKMTTLDEKYIKYAISTDYGVSYAKTGLLINDNKVIFKGYNLGVNKSKTIYLKLWLDLDASDDALNKNYYGNIEVKLENSADIPYANQSIKKTLGSKTGVIGINKDGLLASSKDTIREYRFSGKDVNNYVKYNSELWRIIGVFKENNEEYLKIVRDNVLDNEKIPIVYQVNDVNYELRSNNSNDFYWHKTSTSKVSSDNSFSASPLSSYLNTLKDERNSKGYLSLLSNEAKSMLRKTTYYSGSASLDDTLLSSYEKEKSKSWTGEIALMTASDYGYTISSDNFQDAILNNFEEIKSTSWLYNSKNTKDFAFWLMTSDNDKDNILCLSDKGEFKSISISAINGLRPVVSLKTDVLITSGDGSVDNPYLLSL